MTRLRRTLRAFTLVEIMTSVGVIGLLSAWVVPQLQKVRAHSQDAAVLHNVRQLAAAADLHFAERGTPCATLEDLISGSGYLKDLKPLAGESYPNHFTQDQPIVVRNIGGSRTLIYQP